MPGGGVLTIETGEAGGRVVLSVRDTGAGIPADVLPHIFDPFFTTKGVGRGTGLGLAVVDGIVRQSGGHVEVETEPGRGTTFRVVLPRADGEAGAEAGPAGRAAPPRGSETVLVAEDEPAVRELAAEVLRRSGYEVLEAADGAEALAVFRSHPGPIDLVVTDVVMPGGGGRVLAGRVEAERPGVRVLYLSGYADDPGVRDGEAGGGPFLQKPFTPHALAAKVREVLDAPPRAAR
jgi:CheY-like chemotaxis protein